MYDLIVLGGGLYALANLYYYVLVIARRQKRIFTVYLCAAVLCAVLSTLLCRAWGLSGAAVSYAMMMSLLVFGFRVAGGMENHAV